MIKILLINNDGSGFANWVSVENGSSLEELFNQHLAGKSVSSYTMRVNRDSASLSYLLQDGDRVTITPNKIEGA